MVIDTSALIALLLGEPETVQFVDAIAAARTRLLSAASYLETAIVMLARSGPDAVEKVDRLIADLAGTIVPVSSDHVKLGVAAYRQYGKGSGHPAGLNFGDCFAYALAKAAAEPLLLKGNDFSRTDIASAVATPPDPDGSP